VWVSLHNQACDPDFTAEWLKQHVVVGLGNSSNGTTPWLDAGACALLLQECSLLQRLVGTSPQLMPISQGQVEEGWTQLWSNAQQVRGCSAGWFLSASIVCIEKLCLLNI
jgi:hypothetical protein